MRAIILAAGRGSRLGAMTDEQPKGMVKVAGTPLIARTIAALRAGGVDDIALVSGYRRECLDVFGLPAFHNPDWASTNMVMSLHQADDWLSRDPCLISYSDIFYDPRWPARLAACDADVAITVDRCWLELWRARNEDVLADAETLKTDQDGHLLEIGGRAATVAEIQAQYMGLLRMTPAGWAAFRATVAGLTPARRNAVSMTEVLDLMARAGVKIAAVPVDGQWGEVDTPDDVALYERWAADGVYGDWFARADGSPAR
jgi:L-glutamine-phosphate cytidylyltransferase